MEAVRVEQVAQRALRMAMHVAIEGVVVRVCVRREGCKGVWPEACGCLYIYVYVLAVKGTTEC